MNRWNMPERLYLWQFTLFGRKLNKVTKFIEQNKEKFTQLDLEDVQVREKLKHATSKAKKLEKQLQKDKEKVSIRRSPEFLIS